MAAKNKKEFAILLHERERALFFGTCPNYISNLQIEIDETLVGHPEWETDADVLKEKEDYHALNKYGKKKGSPYQEL